MINLKFRDFSQFKAGDQVEISMPYSKSYFGTVHSVTESMTKNGTNYLTIKMFPRFYQDDYNPSKTGPCLSRDMDPMGIEINVSEYHEWPVTAWNGRIPSNYYCDK